MKNVDRDVVAGFGDEWSRFDQTELPEDELKSMFESYFRIFPWSALPPAAVGADIGCGSGRWARLVASRVETLHCIDPSPDALNVARRNLAGRSNCHFHCASADEVPLESNSLDFAYCLGVLHHVPDTDAAMRSCVGKLKIDAPFLVYLYYNLEDRPFWFRVLWRVIDLVRRVLSEMPVPVLGLAADIIASLVYWPLAQLAHGGERLGLNVEGWPLSYYRRRPFYVMRTDSRDRFGTRLEKRYSRAQIFNMMQRCGLGGIRFSESPPYWTAVGFKR